MEGIVIGSLEYKEKSKIVYLYTPYGKEGIRTLDVAKKLAFATTLNCVEYEKTKANLPTLIEFTLKKSYYSFNQNMAKLDAVGVMIGVINNLEPDAPHQRIYPFFKNCLELLESTDNVNFILALFLVKMLAVFGTKPVLDSCVLCGNKNIVSFSIPDGGALCENCSVNNSYGYETYQEFKYLYSTKEYVQPKELAINYEKLLEDIFSYYLIHVNLRVKDYKIR